MMYIKNWNNNDEGMSIIVILYYFIGNYFIFYKFYYIYVKGKFSVKVLIGNEFFLNIC